MEQLTVSVIELKGSFFELGLMQAEEIKTTPLLKQISVLKNFTAHSNTKKAKELLKDVSPNLLEELKGLAHGLDMELDEIIRLYSGYDITFPSMGCTTFINNDYYVRNYDFTPELYDARLVFSNPDNGYASVGFTQQVIGRLDGMNEKGLVVGLHLVNNEHKGEGFIATTIVRMVLEQCGCIREAIEFLATIPHGYCYNYSIMDSSGEGVIVEASPHKQHVHYGKSLICTNHFQSEALSEENKLEILGSIMRKEYITNQLTEGFSPVEAYHHFNNGTSPLFYKYYQEFFGTLHTVVYSPKDLKIIIGIGENSKPLTLSYRAYMEGAIHLPKVIRGKIDQKV